jgi:ABC-type branched-subunit amino acid transport system substrate-binding protein
MAVAKHNAHADIEVKLEVRDSRGSAVKSVEGTRDLIEGENAVAILGPLLSANAVGAGAMSDCRGVPLITPTAAEEEIAQVGRFVFQRSVGPRTMGERMAAYAVEELELPVFALLAPRDNFGQAAVEGFFQKAQELGSKILAVTWYQAGDTDFREQLTDIRRRKQAYDDSLRALGLFSEAMYSSEQDTLPPEERRVYLDGIFIPAAPSEAGMIAPQIAFHRLETLILGTTGWGARDALRIGGQYMDGVHFATDFSEELSDRKYLDFADGYRDQYGTAPGKVSVFSYECAELVLQGIDSGAHTPEALYQFLAHIEDYPGLAGNISFTRGQGANDQIMILTIQDGRILRLE